MATRHRARGIRPPTARTCTTRARTAGAGATRSRAGHIGALLASALVAIGCGGDGDPAADLAPTRDIEVLGTDTLAFEPDAWAVPVGEEVTLTLRSEAAAEHDLVVEAAADLGTATPGPGGVGDTTRALPTDLVVVWAAAGEAASSQFTITETGTYDVYCSIPGHREAGMVGTLAVVD